MPKRWSALALLLAALWAADASAEGDWLLADSVLASVNQIAITRTQVIQETRFILAEKRRAWSARLPAELLNSVLERMIAKELIYQEMDRIGFVPREGKIPETGKLVTDFGQYFNGERDYAVFLAALGMTERSFAALLLRNAKIEAFIDRRMALLARVGDDDVEKALSERLKQRSKVMDNDQIAQLRQFIREQLERQRYENAFRDWLSDLNSRNSVHRVARFDDDVPPLVVRYDE